MQQLSDGVFYVVGITSFGISCNTSLPSFYGRVSSYIDWIEKTWSVEVPEQTDAPIEKKKNAKEMCEGFGKKPQSEPCHKPAGSAESCLGELPHYASLGYNNTETAGYIFECGGSLVSTRFVLTAGHCCDPSQPAIVRLGKVI